MKENSVIFIGLDTSKLKISVTVADGERNGEVEAGVYSTSIRRSGDHRSRLRSFYAPCFCKPFIPSALSGF